MESRADEIGRIITQMAGVVKALHALVVSQAECLEVQVQINKQLREEIERLKEGGNDGGVTE